MSTNNRPAYTDEQVHAWSQTLLADEGLLGASWKLKRWTRAAIEQLDVGFDGDRYTLPVRDDGFALVGVLRYAPAKLRDDSQPKTIASPGSSRELFPPPESIDGSEIWLNEGEPDTITARSAGLPAVGVPGAGGWKKQWAPRFEGRDVVIVPHCDEPGRTAAQAIADDLLPHAASVRIIVLDERRDDGFDLGDFLADADTLDELRQARELLQAMAAVVAPFEAEPWPPLAALSSLPSFPIDAVPDVVGDWISATAEATQTPLDLAACTALGVISACVSGSVVIEIDQGWHEECCLYIVCALESGERKSSVMRSGSAPLRAVEHERIEQARPLVAKAKTRREIAEQRRRRLMAEVAKSDDAAKREEAAELAVELGEPEPHVPRLLADDATPEALAALLARDDRIAVIAAESALLDNLAGRYADGRSNLHLVCQAYSGEPTTIDRRSREPETLERPLLTLALRVQPFVLTKLVGDPTARAQGFVARCLLVRPPTRLGYRKIDPPPVPEPTSQNWVALVERLAELPGTRDASDRTEDLSHLSRVLRLLPDAHALLTELRASHELHLHESGDLRPIADWHARHAGRIARIAALLHLAADEPGDEISAATVRKALAIGEWSLAHALDVLIGPDDELRRALRWLRRNGAAEISLRDLQRAMHAVVEDARVLAERLEAHGALRPLEQPKPSTRGGRPPSPRFAVHPDLRARGAAMT